MKTSKFLFQKLTYYKSIVEMSPSYRGKIITDENDLELLKDAFYLWCLAMWDYAAPHRCSRNYDVLPQLFLRLCKCDVALLVEWLDSIRAVMYNLPKKASITLGSFKGISLGGNLISSQIILLLEDYCDSANGSSYRTLNSLLCFILKLNIKLDITEKLELEYLQDEDRLSSIDFPDQILHDLNVIIKRWFKDYRIKENDFVPRHGPGSVAGYNRIPISKKYPLLGIDLRLEYFLNRDREDALLDYVRPIVNFDRTAEVVFVPKSLKTYRVICKEPATLQYWQQYVSASLTDFIHSHPYLSKKINLERQDLSRRFCLEASKSGNYATIDLSKASDTVSNVLVKRIFRGTSLLRALVATRSDRVCLPSGKIITTAKFAPMGSALCFPIECIIFAAVCELAIAYSSSNHNRFRVYGDDIIIHKESVSDLFVILIALGFLPNAEKSYTNPNIPYRESCGMEAYNGFDISPVRLSRWFSGIRTDDATSISRMISLANSFYKSGLLTARRAVVSSLTEIHDPPLFSVPYGIGVWSDYPTNFHLRTKWKGGQRWIRHGSLLCKQPTIRLANEDIRLHEWYRMDGNPFGTVSIEKARVVWRATVSPSWFSMIEVTE